MGIANAEDVETTTLSEGETEFRRTKLAAAAGGEELGCSLYELPADSRSWPYHYHTGNEEALFVLAGTGSLRLDGERHPIEAGDYVALPAEEGGAHRVVNDSEGALRYLAVSTMDEPDVTVYPDSGKVGVFAGSAPGGTGERDVHGYFRCEDAVEYWTEEE
jgi:uncharacterized cupin superfamily protein